MLAPNPYGCGPPDNLCDLGRAELEDLLIELFGKVASLETTVDAQREGIFGKRSGMPGPDRRKGSYFHEAAGKFHNPLHGMASEPEPLPDDMEPLQAPLSAERAQRNETVAHARRMEAELVLARALASD